MNETVKPIPRLRGIIKRKPGDKSFAERYTEHKREEIELEEAKYARWTEFRQSRASGTASRHT